MGLIKCIGVNRVKLEQSTLEQQDREVFSGCGAYEKTYHIELDQSVRSAIQPQRKVTYFKLEKLYTTLEELEK